jgi:hypothetical protein
LVALCPAVGLWNNVARMPSITWAAGSSSIANGAMSALGQKQILPKIYAMSALPQ